MFRDKAKQIRKIHLADQQFANRIVGKYGWTIDNGFARSKLQHRIEPKKRDAMTFAKSPIIQLTKVIQPLHIKLIYEYHQLNQMIEYKNAPLLVSSPLSNVSLGTAVDTVLNTTKQQVVTLLEKVKQTAQMKAERQLLQQVQSQIERRTILTTSHHMQGHEVITDNNSQQPSGKHAQETAKLVRTSLVAADQASNQTTVTATNQASNRTPLATVNDASNQISSIALSSGINTNSSSHPNHYSVDRLHHIEHLETTQRVSNKQVAVAKMILSPYIRNIVREEQERIAAELVERNDRNRTKATLHGLVHRTRTLYTDQAARNIAPLSEIQEVNNQAAISHHSIARKAIINKSATNSLERWQRKLTIEQMTMLRQKRQFHVQLLSSKVRHSMSHTNLDQHNDLLVRVEKTKSLQSNREHQTIINNMKYYLKTTPQHINTIKHHQKTLQGVQKLVYIPFINRDVTAVNEKATLIYRNPLTQVDSRITNNQHSYKQEITNSKHSHKHEGSSNATTLSTKQIAIITGAATKQQQRRIEATAVQIRSVTSFHQQLIVRNERLIYQIEMVEKKKTPRARKLSLVPVVKLSYRVLPEEQRKGFVRLPQAQIAVDNGRQAQLPGPILPKQSGTRRQAELIYTVNRKHQPSNEQQTTRQITQQVSQQTTQQKPANLRSTLARAITLTNEERMKQRASSIRLSTELITQRSSYTKLPVTDQLTHISKVNKAQLLQVKVLQRTLKQLQAVTLIVPQISRMGATTIEHSTELIRATHDDGTLSVAQTNYNVNNSQSKQLYYRIISNSSPQQLGVLIHELQKTRSEAIQRAATNVATQDTTIIYKPLPISSLAMNSIVTNRINLIHSSQQQGERLTKRLKQLTTLRKVKDIISTQSPLSIVQVKTTNEQNLQLIVNEQPSKRTSQMVEQVRRNTHSSMNLHIAKQQSTQQDDTKQQDAVKQLEVTVKRLEEELTTAKETKKQSNVNIRQLSDQLFDQLSKRIRLEQRRNGR